MPPIRFLVSKCYAYIVAVILSLGEIMPSYSCYKEKKLVYIIIIALSNRQLFFYSKCIKLNMYSSCNIKLVSNTEYIFISFYNIHNLSQLLSKNT